MDNQAGHLDVGHAGGDGDTLSVDTLNLPGRQEDKSYLNVSASRKFSSRMSTVSSKSSANVANKTNTIQDIIEEFVDVRVTGDKLDQISKILETSPNSGTIINQGDLREALRNAVGDQCSEEELDELIKRVTHSKAGDKAKRKSVKSEMIPRTATDHRLEDQLTNEKLIQLQEIFSEADEDGGGGLDMDEFRRAMRKAMGQHLSDHELDIMFMKVDTNCDGTVDWDEYLSYMLLEYREKDNMMYINKEKPFPPQLVPVTDLHLYQRHHDHIVSILHIPTVTKTEFGLWNPAGEGTGGRYLTMSKEGIVNFWNLELKHQKRREVKLSKKRSDTWVTAAVCLPNLNMVAVATTSLRLSFYDIQTQNFTLQFHIANLDVCAVCMDYWYDPDDISHSILLWGDSRGTVNVLEFEDCPTICVLSPASRGRRRFTLDEFTFGYLCGVTHYVLPYVHQHFVQQIMYCPNLNGFLSCSTEKPNSLYHGDFEGKRKAYFAEPKGVTSFDYSRSHNIIVTGGKDALVRVWNPYVTKQPVMLLHGNKSAIVKVIINHTKDLIISVSETKNIHVYDLLSQTCVQVINKKFVGLGPKPLTGFAFNTARQALLLANNQLAFLEHNQSLLQSEHLTSHTSGVVVLLHNNLFNQVVSGDAKSQICVWDVITGMRSMQFVAHAEYVHGEKINKELTTMEFDPTLRRLITAGGDGFLKVWNFNNGAMLRAIPVGNTQEITGIVSMNKRIITGGWGRQLTSYVDDSDDDSIYKWSIHHTDDIMCMAVFPPSLLISADYKGNILVWSLETCLPNMRFNAHESPRSSPILNSSDVARLTKDPNKRRMSSKPGLGNDDMACSSEAERHYPDIEESEEGSTDDEGEEQHISRKSSNSSINPHDPLPPIGSTLSKIQETTDSTDIFLQSSMSENIKCTSRWNLKVCKRDKIRHEVDINQRSVDKMIVLKKRPLHPEVANLITAEAFGWIRAWSTTHKGGLLGQFNAAHKKGGNVLCLYTDKDNLYLFTAGSIGYIKIWYLGGYCRGNITDEEIKTDLNKVVKFPFTSISNKVREAHINQKDHIPPPLSSQPKDTVKVPKLLNSFRAHLQAITAIAYMDKDQWILSASSDCSIRVWTLTGQFLNIFGQETPWDIPELDAVASEQRPKILTPKGTVSLLNRVKGGGEGIVSRTLNSNKLPSDIRRVASPTTLRVMYGGKPPLYNLAHNIILLWGTMMKKSKTVVKVSEDDPDDYSSTQGKTEAHNILGKSFKVNRKHQRLPSITKPRVFQSQCAVYSSLSFHDLDHVQSSYKPPQTVLEIQERNRLHQKDDMDAAMKKDMFARKRFSRRKGLMPGKKAMCPNLTYREEFQKLFSKLE